MEVGRRRAGAVAVARLAAAVTVGLVLGSDATLGQEAPFGLTWGPVTEVSRPSLVARDGNITWLFYRDDRVPAGVADTDGIVLEVCAGEGLQHVTWVGHLHPEAELRHRNAVALAEGTRRFGTPEQVSGPDAVLWRAGRMTLSLTWDGAGQGRLTMTSAGPDFDACSRTHLELTGHPATAHTAIPWP